MNPMESFLLGIKPALYENTLNKRFCEKLPELMERYPYIDKDIDLFDGPDFYLFFQNEEMKKSSLEKRVQPRTAEFDKVLGLTLGFPPRAVDYYCNCGQGAQKSVSITRGSVFPGAPADLYENFLWMWDRYRYPEGGHVRIKSDMIPVDYMDTYNLEKIQNQVLELEIATD